MQMYGNFGGVALQNASFGVVKYFNDPFEEGCRDMARSR